MNISLASSNIYKQSRRILERIHHVQAAPQTSQTIPLLTLPEPTPITKHLIRTGWQQTAAEQLSNAYIQHAFQLKSIFERNMNNAIKACLETAHSVDFRPQISSVRLAYLAAYCRALSHWTKSGVQLSEQRIWDLMAQHQGDGPPRAAAKRNISELSSRVILESAFSSNPYPTRSEKQDLAYRTGLSYTQVHIWFQNQRSRSKREGRNLRRTAFVLEYHDAMANSPSCDEDFPPRVSPPASSPISEHAESTHSTSCPFEIETAPHAFPNTFPPICDYDPFPVRNRAQLFHAPWPRPAATSEWTRKIDDVPVDVEGLCAPLSRLTLMDEGGSPKASAPKALRRESRLRDCAAICFPSLIRPPTAPLPALLATTVTVRSGSTVQASTSSVPSLSTHTVSVPSLSAAPRRQTSTRNLAGVLPLRISQSLPKQARDASHPYRSCKLPRLHDHGQQAKLPRLSSTSSLSSITSDDSCSSRASSASLESPPPITPPQLSVELPRTRKASSADLVFSPSEDLDHLFSDSDTPTLNFLDSRQPHQPRIVQ